MKTPPLKCGAGTESEGGGDERLRGWAPPQPTDCKPVFNPAAGGSKHDPDGAKAVAIRALFGAAKGPVCRKDAPAPQPRRRRRGETDRGFVAACRKMLRRAPKRQARTIGGNAAFSDLCASAGVFLSDTLDWLNLGEDSAAHDHWHEEEFSATYQDYFPQP